MKNYEEPYSNALDDYHYILDAATGCIDDDFTNDELGYLTDADCGLNHPAFSTLN